MFCLYFSNSDSVFYWNFWAAATDVALSNNHWCGENKRSLFPSSLPPLPVNDNWERRHRFLCTWPISDAIRRQYGDLWGQDSYCVLALMSVVRCNDSLIQSLLPPPVHALTSQSVCLCLSVSLSICLCFTLIQCQSVGRSGVSVPGGPYGSSFPASHAWPLKFPWSALIIIAGTAITVGGMGSWPWLVLQVAYTMTEFMIRQRFRYL